MTGDTVASRLALKWPKDGEEWSRFEAKYSDSTLMIGDHPVMEAWETPYMKELSGVITRHGGQTLEIGYGMGFATRYILDNPRVQHHTVVEAHAAVLEKCRHVHADEIESGRLTVVCGLWQDSTPELPSGSFDGVLFDTYPLTPDELHKNHFPFFDEAYRLLKKGGVLSYYSDEVSSFSQEHLRELKAAGFTDIDSYVCQVTPPSDCLYWKASSFLVPVVKKT